MQSTPVQGANPIGLVFALFFILAMVALVVFIWGTIFRKAGYSFWMALLMFIPLVNLIWLLIFAFGKWPAMAELEMYRQRYGPIQQGFAVGQPPYAQAGYQPPPPPPQA